MLGSSAVLHTKRTGLHFIFHPFKTKPRSVLCTLISHIPKSFSSWRHKRQKDALAVSYANEDLMKSGRLWSPRWGQDLGEQKWIFRHLGIFLFLLLPEGKTSVFYLPFRFACLHVLVSMRLYSLHFCFLMQAV